MSNNALLYNLFCIFAFVFADTTIKGENKSIETLKCDGKILTPISDVALEQQGVCLSIVDLCCVQSRRKTACENGKHAAEQNKDCNIRVQLDDQLDYKHCCEACKLGMITASTEAACKLNNFHFDHPWHEVYETCCTHYTFTTSSIGSNISATAAQSSSTNICELLQGELCSHVCVPVGASYKCQCNVGYTLMADGKSCKAETNDNRCEKYKICHQNCFDNGENVECSCNVGYELLADNTTCVDVNECNLKMDDCYKFGKTCENTEGGYVCVGAGSVNFTNATIATKPQVNVKWATPRPTTSTTSTTSTTPTITKTTTSSVSCQAGYVYSASSGRCIDYNECETNPCDGYEICENQIGSYVCTCKTGFQRDAVTGACIDINECQQRRHHCEEQQRCDNTIGSYQCIRAIGCGTGYTLNLETGKCEDDDECALGTHNCKNSGAALECKNIPGSYRCEKTVTIKTPTIRCPNGYELSKNVCIDIDECARHRNSCRTDQNCVNTNGGFYCAAQITCSPGLKYSDDQTRCVDIDECVEQSRVCDHRCINTWGSFRCICNAGYVLHNDNRSCIDVNECERFKDRRLCIGYCINTPGSYKCQCPDGYKLAANGIMCDDIDECAAGTLCRKPNEICMNMRGTYRCNSIQCPPDYILDNVIKNRCVRINNFCLIHRDCTSLALSYSYNYITFPSNILIPISGQQNFYHLRSAASPGTATRFSLELKNVIAPVGVSKANDQYFRLNYDSANEVTVSLVRPIQGPQDVELELKVTYTGSNGYAGFSISKILLYVSQYEF